MTAILNVSMNQEVGSKSTILTVAVITSGYVIPADMKNRILCHEPKRQIRELDAGCRASQGRQMTRALPAPTFDLAVAVNCANACYEALLVERIRDCRAVCGQQIDGSPECHRANFALIDAMAALDAFRNKRRDEAGVTAWERPA